MQGIRTKCALTPSCPPSSTLVPTRRKQKRKSQSQSLFMDDAVFKRYGAYYDLLYRDKDYEAEAEYVARTLRSTNPAMRSLLEFGSGTGRHGRLIARHGFDVFGVERSESMVVT